MTAALIALAREGLWLSVLLAAPVLVAVVVAGVLTGLIGAVTQVQDAAVSLVPRVAAAAAAMVMFGPPVARELVVFGGKVMATIATLGAPGT